MGLFSNLLGPQDFNGKINKLFNYYKNNTKFVSMGFIKGPSQIMSAISAIADVLGKNTNLLSYDEVKTYGDVFGTVLARSASASVLKSDGLIERTGEMLLERYPFIRTKANANEIANRLFQFV